MERGAEKMGKDVFHRCGSIKSADPNGIQKPLPGARGGGIIRNFIKLPSCSSSSWRGQHLLLTRPLLEHLTVKKKKKNSHVILRNRASQRCIKESFHRFLLIKQVCSARLFDLLPSVKRNRLSSPFSRKLDSGDFPAGATLT